MSSAGQSRLDSPQRPPLISGVEPSEDRAACCGLEHRVCLRLKKGTGGRKEKEKRKETRQKKQREGRRKWGKIGVVFVQ